ncbi:sigma-70 family RNA polymerase sigma factor [Mesobacillus subterraneus]|uniref:sigma-70 family RNA polymerase sigma factor n=1 Tax=Mesobacillus subterraneus TaxID=285983 RepID=UPI002041AE70|nr:sigma-70 family RNA polymerase sigma factor [Mesobacillus subterraneus]MCM3666397.1 sigma-70 family RNA polymerase sigma factor [Mesobacillus subterraneus]MCM3685331.1 sigma-70 family RNA polymerase sigma factor [Mesobacillus subterraneus]
MKITSDNFIKHFKKGKQEALEFVIDEYIGIIKAIIYNTLKSYSDDHSIEECISDTFLGAFENARQFKGNSDDFRRWICTIAKFKAIDQQRKLSKSPTLIELEETQSTVISAEEEYFIQQSTEDLLKMMNQLDNIDREIFIMKYFLNMKNSEIANQLGLSKASVDNRIYRGKKRLQEYRIGGVFL